MRICVVGALAAFLMIGCGGPAPEPVIVEAEGTISYDNEPVTAGIIAFIPIDADAKSSSGGAIKDGRYRVFAESGLKPGKYRVEIRWAKPTGEKKDAGYMQVDVTAEALPDKYNSQSILTADLQPGPNTVNFKLEK